MNELEHKLRERTARIGIIGLGYVGLPLAHVFWQAGLEIVGFDIDPNKIDQLESGETYIKHFPKDFVQTMIASKRFRATCDFSELNNVDAVLVCVPTPLTEKREPDLSFVVRTMEVIAEHMHPEMLVVLESTTYPGTTTEIVEPILRKKASSPEADLLLAFSPEREDPGNGYDSRKIPKIVAGIDKRSSEAAELLYSLGFSDIIRVRDTQTAEAVKITENIFRAVNIALVNELKMAYSKMNIDIWEVIDAAKTKPFGFMPFYPGPGLGGHCIPIDPFYLSWRARKFNVDTHFIELAGVINRAMPKMVVDCLSQAIQVRLGIALQSASVLVMGIAYKKNVDDLRESPALEIIELILALGGKVSYHDPLVSEILPTREHSRLQGMKCVPFEQETISKFDAVIITTDHSSVDYASLLRWSRLVVDTRNATKNLDHHQAIVVKA